MNILHIDTEMSWRGGQNQVRLLIEGLVAKGHKVHLAAPMESAIAHHLNGKVPLLALPAKAALNWTAAGMLRDYCREHLVDIVDAHSAKAHSLACLAHLRGLSSKIVVHRRVDYAPKQHPFNWWKYRCKAVVRYVAISAAIGEILQDYGLSSKRITVVHSAASDLELNFPTKIAAKQALQQRFPQLDASQIWIGNASALSPQKDYPTLLRAVARLAKQGSTPCIIIAGSGSEEAKLKAMAREFALTNVHFLGFVDDIATVLQALDVLAVSSQDEGLGTIILDALQAECSVVATRVGGIPEIIEHGKTGLLADRHDDDQFSQHIQTLLQHETLRKLLADQGRRHVFANFSAKKMVDGNISVYHDLLISNS